MAKSKSIASVPSRVTEGILVDIHASSPVERNGVVVAHRIQMNLATMPVPERQYSADCAGFLISEDFVRLFFAQRAFPGKGIQTLLTVKVSFQGIHQFQAAMESVAETSKGLLKEGNIAIPQLLDMGDSTWALTDPQQVVTLEGNLLAASIAGRSACIDFYYASSFSLHAFQNGGEFRANPAVRVTLTMALLMALYQGVELKKHVIPSEIIGELQNGRV